MGKVKWHDVRDALRRHATAPAPPPAEEFWEAFRAHASLGPPAAERQAERPRALLLPRLAWAAAGAVALAAALVMFTPPATRPPAQEHLVSQVEEVNVFVAYSSVMIMQDEKSGSALVWVAGMGTEGKDG